MKKLTALCIAILMTLTLVACKAPVDDEPPLTEPSQKNDTSANGNEETPGGNGNPSNTPGTTPGGTQPLEATSVIDVLENICVSFENATVSLSASQRGIVDNYIEEQTPSVQNLSLKTYMTSSASALAFHTAGNTALNVTLLSDKEGGDGAPIATYSIIDDMEGIYLLSLLRWYNEQYFAPVSYSENAQGEQVLRGGGQMAINVLKFKEIDTLLADGEDGARVELPNEHFPELITYYRKDGDKYIVGSPISTTQFPEISDSLGKDKLVGFHERSYSIEDGALVVVTHDVITLDEYEEYFIDNPLSYTFGNIKTKFMTTENTSSVEWWSMLVEGEYVLSRYMTVVEGEEAYYLQTYGFAYEDPGIFSLYLMNDNDTNEDIMIKDQMWQDFVNMYNYNGGHSWCYNLYLQAEIAKVGTSGTFRFFHNFLEDTQVGIENIPENWIYQADFDTSTALTSIEAYNRPVGKINALRQFNYSGLIIDQNENKQQTVRIRLIHVTFNMEEDGTLTPDVIEYNFESSSE